MEDSRRSSQDTYQTTTTALTRSSTSDIRSAKAEHSCPSSFLSFRALALCPPCTLIAGSWSSQFDQIYSLVYTITSCFHGLPSNILRSFAVSLCHPPRNCNATPIIRVRLEPEPVWMSPAEVEFKRREVSPVYMKTNLAKLEIISARIPRFFLTLPVSNMSTTAGSPITLSSTDYNIALAARYLTGGLCQGIDIFRG
jgi:hypothetical protein